jgi:hypothetical protein
LDENTTGDTPIYGAKAIAKVVNKSPRATFHLLQAGLLPARKLGTQWVTTPRMLREALLGESA